MGKIILDDRFIIELTNTFDLIEIGEEYEAKDKSGKLTGEIKRVTLNHGYHNTLEQALYKYARINIHSKDEEYTLKDYVKEIDSAFDKAFRRVIEDEEK